MLCLVGLFKVVYEPLLPASPTEYLVTIPPSNPLPAPIVEINWRRSIAEAREEAKRRKLGILIFLLDPSNYYAKQLELDGFRDPEVARFVNRNFVAAKINLDQYPEWSQSILPIQRLGRYIEPGVDLVTTDQDGRLINHYVVEDPFQYSGPESILPFLINSQVKLGEGSKEQPIQIQQSNDFQALAFAKAEAVPAFEEFVQNLKTQLKFRLPGVFEGGSTKFRPMALRVLAKTGDGRMAGEIAQEMAITPLYDALDGGFFREARTSPSSITIDTSKSSSQNALSAEVLAQLGRLLNDPELTKLAIDIGNDVLTEFSEGDSLFASRLNDQDVDLRSVRSSFTRARLDSILTSDQEHGLAKFLTLDRSPGQGLESLTSLSVLADPQFEVLRQTLREKAGVTPALSEPDHIAVDGYIAARLFNLYRYSGDPRFLNKAQQIAKQVYSAVGNDSIARVYGNRQLGPGWLGTYLAVADCGLANFAVTGEIYPLRNGAKALKLAFEKFRDPQSGLLVNTPVVVSPNFAFTSSVPDLADRARESLNSQAVRLAYLYSTIAEDDESRQEFFASSQSVMVRLNSIMAKASIVASGFFDAAFDANRNKAVLVSGLDRIDAANKLAAKIPLAPVFPLSVTNGDRNVRFYIREGTLLRGPFSEAEIQKNLEPTMSAVP